MHHNYMNDIFHRSLTRAGIPAAKEPVGLLRTDGKRPEFLSDKVVALFGMWQ